MQSKSSTAKPYPGDLTTTQFEPVRPLLEGPREWTKPLGTELLAIFNAVLYVLREGCRWRSLPHDFVSQCLAGAAVEVAKRSELHTFAVIPKRRVVERSISWLEKCRRLWRNCERKLESSLAMLSLAFISLLLKRS